MRRVTFSELTLETLRTLAQLTECGISDEPWTSLQMPLTETERIRLAQLIEPLQNYSIQLVNEATAWARAIYPLLMLAEQGNIRAWAEVAVRGEFTHFTLEGIVDGALARGPSGEAEAPYFVVLEAKRSIEAKSPVPQLYGQLLAAARASKSEEMFGCYTIGDTWTFAHATVTDLGAERPQLTITLSQELTERTAAETILSILKGIIARGILSKQNRY